MHNRYMDKIVPMNERNLLFDTGHRYLVDRDTMRPKHKKCIILGGAIEKMILLTFLEW
jgi:hypothetical protein